MEAVCLHLEAIADGTITRLLINISPGTAKSTICSIMFPLWLWSAKNRPGERFLNLSYSGNLPERDNRKMLLIIKSEEFKRIYGDRFGIVKEGQELLTNDRTGYKLALGVNSSVTGNRGSILLYDDPNNVTDVESDTIRESTEMAFREAVSTRLNDMKKSAIIVIQQRTHQGDISGVILEAGLPYCHLCIPAIYEGTSIPTDIGWVDPRTEIGESFWPERYPLDVLEERRQEMGEHAFVGQFQQIPVPRGGGILKSEYWQEYYTSEFPVCDHIIASLDPAFTDRQSNDPSGLVVLGAFLDKEGHRAVVLLYAERIRKGLCGPYIERWPGETDADYRARTFPEWGLVETVNDICKRYNVKHLLIEAKGPGLSVAQTMRNILNRSNYTIETVDPGKLDKQARMMTVSHIFTAGMVYAPRRAWADMVIDECAAAPRGRTDDLVDALTQALHWLDIHKFLIRREEQFEQKQDALKRRKTSGPLYLC